MGKIFIWIIGIVFIWFIFSSIGNIGKYEGQTAEEWFNAYDDAEARAEELQERLYAYEDALNEANDNIESAKRYTGSSWEDMEYALYHLDTVTNP